VNYLNLSQLGEKLELFQQQLKQYLSQYNSSVKALSQELVMSIVSGLSNKVHQFHVHQTSPAELKILHQLKPNLIQLMKSVGLNGDDLELEVGMDTSHDEELARQLEGRDPLR
jgi:hypothetical protein